MLLPFASIAYPPFPVAEQSVYSVRKRLDFDPPFQTIRGAYATHNHHRVTLGLFHRTALPDVPPCRKALHLYPANNEGDPFGSVMSPDLQVLLGCRTRRVQ